MNDKAKHFLVSMVGTVAIGSIYGPLAGAVGMILVGIAKEIWDDRPGGSGFDMDDIIADGAGIFVGVMVLFLWNQ